MTRRIASGLITFYQRHLRCIVPSSCRFYPSCSEYAKQAIEKYGFFQGALKAAKRILQCHPYSGKAGYDPLT